MLTIVRSKCLGPVTWTHWTGVDAIRTAHQELAEAAQAIADALYSGAMEGADDLAEELYDEDDFADEAF